VTPEQLRTWGRYATTSPIYSRLVEAIAADDELLRVLSRIEHTPPPNLLFAGVQYLMMRDGGAGLSRYYPNFDDFDPGADGLENRFREFVLDHEESLVEIGRTRHTQTNECRRCVALLPAIWMVGHERFHLVDVGTSAGLNLMLDRYRYRWDGVAWGPESPVLLETESRGRVVAPRPIEILSRTGLDLHPIDPLDPDERLWLEALIWPEHHDRRQRLRAALGLAVDVELDLVPGNAAETLGPTLSGLPRGEAAIVMHSFALNQFAKADRWQLDGVIDDARTDRDVGRVSFEASNTDRGSSVVTIDDGTDPVEVGRAQHHGEWIDFYARP
jgi:hypothetical protein